MTTATDISELSVNRLATEADCAGPDSPESPGARFLDNVRGGTLEALEYGDEPDEIPHSVADSCVPVYTHELWKTFVDLCAYNEDPTELGSDGSDMTQAAQTCLYLIGVRLSSWIVIEVAGSEDDAE